MIDLNNPNISPDRDFNEVKECVYKGEHYSIRDNGAVSRHTQNRKRPLDGVWTFGKKDNITGYMTISGARVHIIVATAFHGEHDSKVYVVDHIDTNRCNNRPENLRWLTRLENALNNPVTRKRIEYLCGGDIQKFINNPSCLQDLTGTNSDLTWMRTVSSAEARNAYERVMSWAAKQSEDTPSNGGKLGEWIFQKPYEVNYRPSENFMRSTTNENGVISEIRKFTNPVLPDDDENSRDYTKEELFPKYSITSNKLAAQIGWSPYTKPEFPCCPTEINDQPIQDYYNRLKQDDVFVSASYGASFVYEFALYEDKILVITKIPEGIKKFGLTEIEWNGEVFIHTSQGTFFEENGVKAAYTRAQGKEWTGPDSIDDYC